MAEKKSAGRIRVKGKRLICGVCDHDRFWHRSAQLNSVLASFFGFERNNRSAVCMICDRCGHIHWFLPAETDEKDHSAG